MDITSMMMGWVMGMGMALAPSQHRLPEPTTFQQCWDQKGVVVIENQEQTERGWKCMSKKE